MVREVVVVQYDPDWPRIFSEESQTIQRVLGDELVEIHHIGSTAIPGISAKPIIDMMPVVKEISRIDLRNTEMAAIGYKARGEYGIPGRRYFIKEEDGVRRFHVHAFEQGNSEIDRHLDFRDFMIAFPEEAGRYGKLKEELASRYSRDVKAYVSGKDPYIREVDEKAARWKAGLETGIPSSGLKQADRNTVIRLIHWNPIEANQRCAELEDLGYEVEGGEFGRESLRELKEEPPDLILIDLTRLPSQGRDLAVQIRRHSTTRTIPLLFVGGDPVKVERVKSVLPDASFTDWGMCGAAIESLILDPPDIKVIPDTAFAAYAGTPLWKKLGIRSGDKVALIGAPEDFETLLSESPSGVRFDRDATSDSDLTLWFVRSQDELAGGMEEMGKKAGSGGLWIVWPKKSSGVDSDLTQNIVREMGLSSGLVDFKICSIDRTWSGLRFSRRSSSA